MSRWNVALVLSALACGDPHPAEQAAGLDALTLDQELPAEVVDDLAHGIPVRLLVELGVDPAPEHPLTDPRRLAAFAERWPAVIDSFESSLPFEAWIARSYRNLPVLAVDVDDLDAAYAVLDHHDVVRVEADRAYEPAGPRGRAIGQPAAAALGHTGAGTAVVLLDSGLDPGSFGCDGVGAPDDCPVVEVVDIAEDDGRFDRSGHGTALAKIVHAIAPGAGLIGLDIFDGGYAHTADLLAGLDWAVEHQAEHNIAAVNLSLMWGASPSECGGVLDRAVSLARRAGMSVVGAAGNGGFVNALSWPACMPEVFSVGASLVADYPGVDCTGGPRDANTVACYSNSASFLDVLAPNSDDCTTSHAAAVASGALAVLRGADPNAGVDELEDRLRETGVPITDRRNGLTFPRLDLGAAVEGLGCGYSIDVHALDVDALGESGLVQLQTDPGCAFTASSDAAWLALSPDSGQGSAVLSWTALPNVGLARTATLQIGPHELEVSQRPSDRLIGDLTIDGGAPWTNTNRVTLSLGAEGSDRMCISNNPNACTEWEPWAPTRAWALKGGGGGERAVYAWFEVDGMVSEPAHDTIIFDRRGPHGGFLHVTGSIEGVRLYWVTVMDDLTGVASYIVSQAPGSRAPASRCTEDRVYEGTDREVFLTGLDGHYTWRLCGVDGAGNVGNGITISFATRPEYEPPEGSITIADGADFTNDNRLEVALSATDESEVTAMCLSQTEWRCTRYVPFGPTATVTVRSSGHRTVYAWFRDEHGNEGGPFSDAIVVEREAPVDGTVAIETSDRTITLTVSDFWDAISGVAAYRVMGSTTSAAPARRCRTGDVLYEGPGDTIVIPGLPNGQRQLLHVCAIDAAGNVSSGVAGESTPVPERDGPTGSIELAGGARYTRDLLVTAALTAHDASGVAEMCVTTRPPCRRFSPFASQVQVAVGSGDTTVHAWLRDVWGNESEALTDIIGLDRTAPTDGTLTASPADGALTVSFDGFHDEESGVESYALYQLPGTVPPRSCRGEPTWTGTATSATFAGLSNGQPYSFLVCAIDAVGNRSRGARGTFAPAPELAPPTGAALLDGGAAWTRSRRVELTLQATDESGVARMCVDASGRDSCTRWTSFRTPYVVTLPGGAGPLPVRVWLEDVWGNRTPEPIEASIGLDETRPVDGTLKATVDGAEVALDWSGFADPEPGSGLVRYTVVAREGRTPSNCRIGQPVYEGTGTAAVATGLSPGTPYGFRVCATDAAGNDSRGAASLISTEP